MSQAIKSTHLLSTIQSARHIHWHCCRLPFTIVSSYRRSQSLGNATLYQPFAYQVLFIDPFCKDAEVVLYSLELVTGKNNSHIM